MGSVSHDSRLTNSEPSDPPPCQLVPPSPPSSTSPHPRQSPIVFHPATSSEMKVRTFAAAVQGRLLTSGIIYAPTPSPESLTPPVHEIFDTIDEHAELKGADAAALLKESSPVVAIAYELARRGWLTIDHAHQIYLGLHFGKSAMEEELNQLLPQPQSTTPTEKLSEHDARAIIEALLPAELQPLWSEVFREARLAKYSEDTGSYLYLKPKSGPLAKQAISEFSLQVLSLKEEGDLPTHGRSTVVVAKIGEEYHAKIFDKRGRVRFGHNGSRFTPDQVHELDAMITERLTGETAQSRFPPSDAEILDGVAASVLLRPLTFADLFSAAKSEPEGSPLKKLTASVFSVARFNARARIPDQQLGDPDPASSLTEEEPESIQASSTSRHLLSPSRAAARIDPKKKVLQQVDCLFALEEEPIHSWNDLISHGVSPVCSMQKSLVQALSQAPLGRLEQELPILRHQVKVVIITPSSLSPKKVATLNQVARSLRTGAGAHEVEFLTYEEALKHHLTIPSPENPSPQNSVRIAGLVVLLDPGYSKKGDESVSQRERNLFFRLALSQQINSTPPTAFPFDTLQQTLIIGSREECSTEDPKASATTVLWQLLASTFDTGMMKNPPTVKFLDETLPHADEHGNTRWMAGSTYPDGLPRLSTIAKSVRRLIKTADAKPQGVSGYYQYTACDLRTSASDPQSSSHLSSHGTITVLPVAGLGSASEIVPDAELARTRGFWSATLRQLQGDKEHSFPLSREAFIHFFTRARFPLTELEGLRFEAIREEGGYRIGETRLSQELFRAQLDQLAGTSEEREDRLVRRLLEENEVALLDEGTRLCTVVVNNYPRGIPSPRDGAGAKPDGRFNWNTMSEFGKRVVTLPSDKGTLCFLFPLGVTTDPLARIEGIGEKSTAHGHLFFSNNIDVRTATILGADSPGGAPFLIDAQPGGVGTAQEIFSAPGNIIIVEKDSNDRLARLFCAERERQGLPYTLIRANEPVEPVVAAALQAALAHQPQRFTWDEFMRDFPVWDTGISEL